MLSSSWEVRKGGRAQVRKYGSALESCLGQGGLRISLMNVVPRSGASIQGASCASTVHTLLLVVLLSNCSVSIHIYTPTILAYILQT